MKKQYSLINTLKSGQFLANKNQFLLMSATEKVNCILINI